MATDAPNHSGPRTASNYRDIADALRSRVDLFGKTLAGLATVGTGAVGLAKLGDLFPEDVISLAPLRLARPVSFRVCASGAGSGLSCRRIDAFDPLLLPVRREEDSDSAADDRFEVLGRNVYLDRGGVHAASRELDQLVRSEHLVLDGKQTGIPHLA